MSRSGPCFRCGYDREAEYARAKEYGLEPSGLRTMLSVSTRDAGVQWVCARCHGPREAILGFGGAA